MFKSLKSGIFNLSILATILLSTSELSAASRKPYKSKVYSIKNYSKKSYTPKSYTTKSYNRKPYTKKASYAGYGKPSKVNGLPKTKITSGHVKKTSKGYTYVNPYARSNK